MPRHHVRGSLGRFAVLMVVWSSASFAAAQTSNSPVLTLRLHPRGLNAIVASAVLEAHRRLGSEGCRQVFSAFRDSSSEPLQHRLEALGQTGQTYLGWLWFVDGGVEGRCERPEVVAFTTPGSQVVRYCGDRFTRALATRGLGFVASTVIHEELHSLGLGENPPSSEEITRRVEAACGS